MRRKPNRASAFCADTDPLDAACGVATITGAVCAAALGVAGRLDVVPGVAGSSADPTTPTGSAGVKFRPASGAGPTLPFEDGGEDVGDADGADPSGDSTTTEEADGLTGDGSKVPAEPRRLMVVALGAGPSPELRGVDAEPPVLTDAVRLPRAVERSRADGPVPVAADLADESVESVESALATAGIAAIATPTPRAAAKAPTRPI